MNGRMMKILMVVLTSRDQLGNTGRKPGFWLEELAAPYYRFREAGAEIVLASPKGGQPPLDPKSNELNFQTELTHRFEADDAAKAQLASTVRLDNVRHEDFDTVFYPGGRGPMWIWSRTRIRSAHRGVCRRRKTNRTGLIAQSKWRPSNSSSEPGNPAIASSPHLTRRPGK
jgi:putative intracellular protease/amidase